MRTAIFFCALAIEKIADAIYKKETKYGDGVFYFILIFLVMDVIDLFG